MQNNNNILTIVSDTPFTNNEGVIFAHEPTLREVENLTQIFSKIYWLGYSSKGKPSGMQRSTDNLNIKFIELNATGGSGLFSKLNILIHFPVYIFQIITNIRKGTHVHTRMPSWPGVIALLLSVFNKKPYWNKFAGSWEAPTARSYQFQKWLLIKFKNTKVSINGKWPGQPKHVISFWNPCMTEHELNTAIKATERKSIDNHKLNFLFVGRIEGAKGIDLIYNFFSTQNSLDTLNQFTFIGEGTEKQLYEEKFSKISPKFKFVGALSRTEINKYYEFSNFILLPSQSEGFPKVIAEASAYGCIPITSDVSSLKQFIHHEKNGFIFEMKNTKELTQILNKVLLNLEVNQIKIMSRNSNLASKKFTYEDYNMRVLDEIYN